MATRVLWLEESLATTQEMRQALERASFRVDAAPVGRAGLRQLLVGEYDLVILGMSGCDEHWEFCDRLVSLSETPLLLLLDGCSDLDRVRGLELGADDCLSRPSASAELVARARALVRRGASSAERRQRSFFADGDLAVDLARHEVRLQERPVALTRTEFRILSCLVRYVDEVVPQERLISQVWGRGAMAVPSSLKQHIHYLRRKLEADPSHPRRILTRWGEGYLLRRLEAEQGPP